MQLNAIAKIAIGTGLALTGGAVLGATGSDGTSDNDSIGLVGLATGMLGFGVAAGGFTAIDQAARIAGRYSNTMVLRNLAALMLLPAGLIAVAEGVHRLMDGGRARPAGTIEQLVGKPVHYSPGDQPRDPSITAFDRALLDRFDQYEGWGAHAGDGILATQDVISLNDFLVASRPGS